MNVMIIVMRITFDLLNLEHSIIFANWNENNQENDKIS